MKSSRICAHFPFYSFTRIAPSPKHWSGTLKPIATFRLHKAHGKQAHRAVSRGTVCLSNQLFFVVVVIYLFIYLFSPPHSRRTRMIFWWRQPSVQVMMKTWKSVNREQVGFLWQKKTPKKQEICKSIKIASQMSVFTVSALINTQLVTGCCPLEQMNALPPNRLPLKKQI